MTTKILVADDANFMRTMIKNIFREAGYEVIGEASNGDEAIEKYQELKPDIVTMDITMPGMDGIAATKRICNEDPDAKIIICSAMGQQALIIKALQAGARDFIVKPFEKDRVINAVKKIL